MKESVFHYKKTRNEGESKKFSQKKKKTHTEET